MVKFKLFGFGSNETTPAEPQSAAEARAVPEFRSAPQMASRGKRVLIVDDDAFFLRATATKLESAGFEVITAQEGSEAIAALGEEAADTVLMDINFPADVCNGGMGSWDGFQIMYWLRGLPAGKGARFIMVSNSDTEWDRQKARDLGAVAYLQKPLDHDYLIALLNAEN